ncbi:MAG TPA: hypothetical protein VMU00_06050 [Steroidobacteraceae bacterium]|nr:hypothetical protein [Steroidobacteraceae bacterium]
MTRPVLSRLPLALLLALSLPAARAAAEPPAAAVEPLPALEWRLLGPFRGGWSTMAVGVPGEPDTFYAGAAGGGVWKTTDAGRTWRNLTDAQPITAVGALAVAPSDPRVVYVGTGQPEPRYDIGAGSGVYRSTDAGRSWTPLGLAASRHIGAIAVDRRDANVVLVAALGHVFGPGGDRGVYRSDDGGRSWTRTLYVDESTGAVDLAVDPADPDLVYAATWTVRVWPWLSYFTPLEGEGSALWRSRDGGLSWQRLGGAGWPAGPLGRIGLAATRAGGAARIYASVSRSAGGGLYRSDDGGGHWARVHDAHWLTSWYMSRLTVAPDDPDTLYTVGQSVHESRDGGKTFSVVRGAPGGDDFHYLWINPKDPSHRVAASDQGAIVTVNGGATWGDWYNQPTGQFYYLAADDRFPYRVYSGQQDSGTVAIASRGDYGSISLRDWQPVGGDERDYDVPDPEDPAITFASGLGGRIARYDARTGEVANVTPWPVESYGKRPTDYRYHYNWFTPITFSRQGPHLLYAGAQVLFRSADRGAHWEVVSPDLSARQEGAQGCGGSPAPAQALACGYGAINVIAPSPADGAEIWVGTDDGRVWLTRDGAQHWRGVTPPAVPAWAKVGSIDLVAASPGTAYVAVDNHRQDDVRPYVYRTRDYGASWTEIGAGLPADHFVSVVRADPARAGLLYAGTELGVAVSFDDGAHWQSLSLNLPPAWVHDLLVKDRDLIAATVGRALWVLDDLAPLRQRAAAAGDGPRLYAPSPAYRLRANQNRDTPLTPETPLARNPPTGAVIDYYLPRAARAPVVLEIRDAAGALVRRYTSADAAEDLGAEPYFEPGWLRAPARLSGAPGAHRFVWDLRYPRPPALEYQWSIAASPFDGAALLPAGALALPGDYRLALTVDGRRLEAPLAIRPDPRVATPRAELEAALAFSNALAPDLAQVWRASAEISAVRHGLAERRAALAAASPLAARLAALDAALEPMLAAQAERPFGLARAGETLAAIETDVEGADRAPTQAQRAVAAAVHADLAALLVRWRAIRGAELAAVNRALAAARLAPVVVPDAAHLPRPELPGGQDLP